MTTGAFIMHIASFVCFVVWICYEHDLKELAKITMFFTLLNAIMSMVMKIAFQP